MEVKRTFRDVTYHNDIRKIERNGQLKKERKKGQTIERKNKKVGKEIRTVGIFPDNSWTFAAKFESHTFQIDLWRSLHDETSHL